MRTHSRVFAVGALVLALPGGLGCARTQLAATAPSIQQATLSVDDREYQLDACSSGDLEYFLGVDLVDQSGSAFVRVVIDPMQGPRLRIVLRESNATVTMLLGREQCRHLAGDTQYTGWEINNVRDFSGFVDAECTSESGQAIRLHVRFSHCH